MSAADLIVWGVVLHLLVDWLGQNDWIALNKAKLRHPAGWVHAGMHGAIQLLIFPWWAALGIGVAHLLIDTRKPVAWWSRLIRQTQPNGGAVWVGARQEPYYDLGLEIRIWADQVWHVGVIAVAALVGGTV